MKILEFSNNIITAIKDRFLPIEYLKQLETLLMRKDVNYEVYTYVVIFMVTSILRVQNLINLTSY